MTRRPAADRGLHARRGHQRRRAAREDRPRRAAPAQAAPVVGAPPAGRRPRRRLRDARARRTTRPTTRATPPSSPRCASGAPRDRVIAEARQRVLDANGGSPPKVLDLFAGGGAIPLEALRLGCEATAVELNPVAHLIEKCMLEYPQRFGPSLADDIREHGRRWVERTWARVGHLYPRLREADDQSSSASTPRTRPASAPRDGRSPTCGRARCRAPTPSDRRTPCRSCARPGWRRRRAATSRCARSSTATRSPSPGRSSRRQTPSGLGFDPAGFSKRGASHVPGLRRRRRRQATSRPRAWPGGWGSRRSPPCS